MRRTLTLLLLVGCPWEPEHPPVPPGLDIEVNPPVLDGVFADVFVQEEEAGELAEFHLRRAPDPTSLHLVAQLEDERVQYLELGSCVDCETFEFDPQRGSILLRPPPAPGSTITVRYVPLD